MGLENLTRYLLGYYQYVYRRDIVENNYHLLWTLGRYTCIQAFILAPATPQHVKGRHGPRALLKLSPRSQLNEGEPEERKEGGRRVVTDTCSLCCFNGGEML